MKYNITINQRAIVENKLDLDLKDAVILDFMYSASLSSKVTKMLSDNDLYFWIKSSFVKDQNPLLMLEGDSIYRRMVKIQKAGLIKAHVNNQTMSKSYYCFTDFFFQIFVQDDEEGAHTYGSKSEGATDENPKGATDENPKDNININNNYINNNIFLKKIPDAKDPVMKEINSFTKKCFLDKYSHIFETEFIFSAKESGKLRPISSKIFLKMKEKNPSEISLGELKKAIELYIHASWEVGDNFIKSNFNLTTLDSKFNDIFVKIKNKSNGKSATRTTQQSVRDESREFARKYKNA